MTTSLLRTDGLAVGYGAAPVVEGLQLELGRGEVVALLGANGVGKTTTMLALAGRLTPSAGSIRWLGTPLTASPHRRARDGLRFVSEQRAIVRRLTTRDNLRLGFGTVDEGLALFPALEPLLKREAGLLSGGEQQMLALALALGGDPKAVLIDELSFGLAPIIVDRLLEVVRTFADQRGVGVLLVEQHVQKALRVADRAYVLRGGSIVLQGSAAELSERVTEIQATYLTA